MCWSPLCFVDDDLALTMRECQRWGAYGRRNPTRQWDLGRCSSDLYNVRFRPIAVIRQVLHDSLMADKELTARLVDADGRPLGIAGGLLDIRFYVGGQFRYSFTLGRTDVDGVCRTSFEEIERQLEANLQLFLMD